MTLDDLNKHLPHKKKSVSELIRFIGNTADGCTTSNGYSNNYSILLGSGASVSSGIRSGQSLIEDWKKTIYEEDDTPDKCSIDDYYKPANAPDWYEESNAYCALFEKMYDLQRQRRMFVEREVADKTPSIGYAFLVKLIDKGIFKTVFTTNFDDLLNEAFYRFSNNRPIVCAHDSSIAGISVTSSRPKIIKLHGDYLFDNIKATLRETESLETNMKMKFQEFAKDFGLIVVGYSGQDRSIMDILSFLLQREDYFKNGIFWCIRKTSADIPTELKKLLMKDRVYFVEIDGFDELFAEINKELNNNALPIDDAFLSMAHQEKIIKELTDNDFIKKSKSSVLKTACEQLYEHLSKSQVNDYIKLLAEKNNPNFVKKDSTTTKRKQLFEPLTDEESKEFQEYKLSAFGESQVDSVLNKLKSKNIFSMPDSLFKMKLLELEADLKEQMSDEEVEKYFDELIRLDQYKQKYYLIAANRSSNIKQSISFLQKAYDFFKNDYFVANNFADRLIDKCEDYVGRIDKEEDFKQIEDALNRSLTINPCIKNNAYSLLCSFLKIRYSNNMERQTNEIQELCKKVFDLDKLHPQTLTILRRGDSKELTLELINASIEFYRYADNPDLLEKSYLELFKWYKTHNNVEETLQLFTQFENEFVGSHTYCYKKAIFLMEQEYLEDALSLFKSIRHDVDVVEKVFSILRYLNRPEEIDEIYSSLRNKEKYRIIYYENKEMYNEVVDYYKDKEAQNEELSIIELNTYSYALLKCKKYQDVEKLLKQYFENPNMTDCSLLINFLIARQKRGNDIDSAVQRKIIDNKFIKYSDAELFGAYCILNNKKEALKHLKEELKTRPFYKYSIADWPVFEVFKNDEDFKKVLKPEQKKLDSKA